MWGDDTFACWWQLVGRDGLLRMYCTQGSSLFLVRNNCVIRRTMGYLFFVVLRWGLLAALRQAVRLSVCLVLEAFPCVSSAIVLLRRSFMKP